MASNEQAKTLFYKIYNKYINKDGVAYSTSFSLKGVEGSSLCGYFGVCIIIVTSFRHSGIYYLYPVVGDFTGISLTKKFSKEDLLFIYHLSELWKRKVKRKDLINELREIYPDEVIDSYFLIKRDAYSNVLMTVLLDVYNYEYLKKQITPGDITSLVNALYTWWDNTLEYDLMEKEILEKTSANFLTYWAVENMDILSYNLLYNPEDASGFIAMVQRGLKDRNEVFKTLSVLSRSEKDLLLTPFKKEFKAYDDYSPYYFYYYYDRDLERILVKLKEVF